MISFDLVFVIKMNISFMNCVFLFFFFNEYSFFFIQSTWKLLYSCLSMENMYCARNHCVSMKSKHKNWFHTRGKRSYFWWKQFGHVFFRAICMWNSRLRVEFSVKLHRSKLNSDSKVLSLSESRKFITFTFFQQVFTRTFCVLFSFAGEKIWAVDRLWMSEFTQSFIVNSFSNKNHNQLPQVEHWVKMVLISKWQDNLNMEIIKLAKLNRALWPSWTIQPRLLAPRDELR